MKRFRKTPDSVFVKKIRTRLDKRERTQTVKRQSFRLALALIFVFGMSLIFSQTARAEVLQTVQQVQIIICNSKLGIDCGGDGIFTTTPNEYVPLSDVQDRFASPVILPAYVPQGFERRVNVEFFDITDQPALVVTWDRKNDFRLIKLVIARHSIDIQEYAQTLGKGAIEETVLNGKPAIIVRGVWNIGIHDNDFMMTALMWRYDENTVYALLSLEQAVPLTELKKMAESIP